MVRKTVSGMLLSLLLIAVLTLTFNVQRVEASETIYIRADGSVDPDTAPILSVDNVTYTFTDNIYDRITVERDNIIVDGAGYTLQGTGDGTGIYLLGRSNVTIKNTEVKSFWRYGIQLSESSNNTISGNTITNNTWGVYLSYSSNNTVSGNTITASHVIGISCAYESSYNTISGNTITNNNYGIIVHALYYNTISGNTITNNSGDGVYLVESSYNMVSGNNITNNYHGIQLYKSSNNSIHHNNLVDNTEQVHSRESTNVWDDGYPSGGNYWSNYVCTGNPSDGTQPYIVDESNVDYYPFQDPSGWLLPSPPSGYTLTIWSLPNGVTFAVDGMSHTTPWSRTYGEGASVSLIMPEIDTVGDAGYFWNQWSDGYPSRSRTITMTTNITLAAHYTGPYYQLTIKSSRITGIPFTINGIPQTTQYTEWRLEGSYTLAMPEIHNEYVWSHWLEDGNANQTKTLLLSDNTTWTGVFKLLADLNGDDKVRVDDVLIAAEAFGSDLSHPRWNPAADLDSDGRIRVNDILTVALNFGKTL